MACLKTALTHISVQVFMNLILIQPGLFGVILQAVAGVRENDVRMWYAMPC